LKIENAILSIGNQQLWIQLVGKGRQAQEKIKLNFLIRLREAFKAYGTPELLRMLNESLFA
jgi:hypothetical protein